jgi:serine/threonine protein kinase
MNAPVQNFNGYYVKRALGNGAFGQVYLVEKGGQKFAMKRIKIQPQMEDAVEQEVMLHKSHNHPNIVQCVDYFFTTDGNDRYCYMVNEFCDQGTLESYLKKGDVPHKLLLKWIKELLEAITYIHGEGVIHRDIKPENILIAGNTIKLGKLAHLCLLYNWVIFR